MILTGAFYVVLVCGYFFAIGRIWQGRSQYDPSQPPAFWPFSLPLWRGVARAFPVQGAAVLVLIGGGIAGDLIGEGEPGYNIAMGIGSLGLLALFLLAFPITFFNRPRFLVPPHQRDEPGAVEEWRSARARR